LNLEQHFLKLDKLLSKTCQWWQFAAFHSLESRWKTLAPELHHLLEQRSALIDSSELIEPSVVSVAITANFSKINLHEFIPELSEINQLTQIPKNIAKVDAPTCRWQYQIAGRKWSQITRFVPHIPKRQKVLEWCSGKGHLGRLTASHGASSLLSLEWQAALCDTNRELNQRLAINDYCDAQVNQCDVMSEAITKHLNHHQFPIALHACGDLHTRLIKQVAEHNMHGVCLAPCCYNLISAETYQALSTMAKQSHLSLSKLDLSLPLRQTVTAGQREQREQSQEKLWRMAFDCWQRQVRFTDEYMPLPTIPKRILKSNFKTFIQWTSEVKQHPELMKNSQSIDALAILDAAQKRMPGIQQMEWVQHHFQRAIEIWLLLDQALYLQENGYQCEIFEFCEQRFTPRNLMLKACRSK
jgi:hypothetical protein